ncbi:MAG TPA: ricin-type beta-trefoil lectin domain protein, partial [Myxococcota bacterium]|nr:ricin-type beta-trefoil lectin domain protein [Myxococcota bacterium]
VTTCTAAATQTWTLSAGRLKLSDGRCLDVFNGLRTAGISLVLAACSDAPTATQGWIWADGTLQLVGSALCATLPGENANSGATVALGPCTEPRAGWDMLTSNGASETGVSVAPGGRALCLQAAGTDNGSAVSLVPCAQPIPAQRWSIVGGTLRALGKCLDLVNNSTAQGAPVQLWECNGLPEQQWMLDQGLIQQRGGGQCVGAVDGTNAAGSAIAAWRCSPDARQQWVVGGP